MEPQGAPEEGGEHMIHFHLMESSHELKKGSDSEAAPDDFLSSKPSEGGSFCIML